MTTYDTDFYLWSKEQSSLLREKEYTKLDIENLIEEIESLGRNERNRLESFLRIYFCHKLKFEYQPQKRTRSWENTLRYSLRNAIGSLKENPSLKPKVREIMHWAYDWAVLDAEKQTGILIENFPETCPWKVQEIFEDIEDKYKE